jgi:hypothetical protein
MPETLIPGSAAAFISYARLREKIRTHPLIMAEIPFENHLSLPLPTRRFSAYGAAYAAAYVVYSAPAVTLAGQPKREGAPDRWAAFSAHGGGLLLYALCDLLPFANAEQSAPWRETVEIAAEPGETYASFDAALARIVAAVETLAPAFFRGEAGDPAARKAFLRDFAYFTPAPLQERHRAAAPDFFVWLEQ